MLKSCSYSCRTDTAPHHVLGSLAQPQNLMLFIFDLFQVTIIYLICVPRINHVCIDAAADIYYSNTQEFTLSH